MSNLAERSLLNIVNNKGVPWMINFQADKLVDIRLRYRNKIFLINEPRIFNERSFRSRRNEKLMKLLSDEEL